MADTFTKRLNDALSIRNMKPVELATKAGCSKALISQYMNGIYTPKPEKLYILAKALDVNPAWLMGYSDDMEIGMDELTKKADRYESFSRHDEKDIANSLNFLIEQLDKQEAALMFSGEPMDDETKELLKASLENSLRIAKIKAKQKFTPTKYRK